MIKTRALLAASAALTILFSPSIFAESYKECQYTHEEYELVNGVKSYDFAGAVHKHVYHYLRIDVTEDCPDVPPALPGHPGWVPNSAAGDDEFSFFGQITKDKVTCQIGRKVLTHTDNWDIR